jgi:hypothetical protein
MSSESRSAETGAAGQSQTLAERWLIGLAVVLIAAAVLRSTPLQSANDRSRWATVWSLVERRTYRIDEIDQQPAWATIDKVRVGESPDGPWHFYSSKPPLLSTIVAGLYAIERHTLGWGLFRHPVGVSRLLLLIVNVWPFLLMLRSLRRSLVLLQTSECLRLIVLAAAGFGSLLNPYLTTLNNHTPAAAAAMLAMEAALRLVVASRAGSGIPAGSVIAGSVIAGPWTFAALGFFAALTSTMELPAAVFGVLAFLLALRCDVRKTWASFVPAAVIPLAAFCVTNWVATGGIKPFYAGYGSSLYVYEHNGVPSYWSQPRDLDANAESLPAYLFHCLIGHHGLLSLSPVLLLSVAGVVLAWRPGTLVQRRFVAAMAGVLTIAMLGFYLSRTQNYNYGGNSFALRWMLWLSPLWWLAMVPAAERVRKSRSRVAVGVLLAASILTVSWSLDRPWKPSWLYEAMESAGWINYRTRPAPFDPPRRSVIAQLPDKPGTSMTWRNIAGEQLILSVVNGPPATGEFVELACRQIRTHSDTTTRLRLDRKKFEAGTDLAGCITPSDSEDPELQSVLRALRGLPAPVAYNAGGVIHVPSYSRPGDAWKVERGAARVLKEDRVRGSVWHRCDVQYCRALPFGVLQWRTQVLDAESGDVLQSDTWTLAGH